MPPRLAVVLGLLAGVVSATLALAALVAFVPGPTHPALAGTPLPSVAAVSPSPSSPVSSGPSAGPSAGSSASTSPSPSPGPAFFVGQPAPALRVTRVGGGTIDLAALRGKPVWLNFMQTTSPPSVEELPLMNGFSVRYAGAGLVVLAVDVAEDETSVKAFAEGLKATFPIGLDPKAEAQRTWDAFALPVHFWIDKDGIVRAGALGGIGPDVMAASLQKILPGTTVTP
jgi:cytochrome c biogenesis protein CcmG/thiol:disulfide interchange protein DsbE